MNQIRNLHHVAAYRIGSLRVLAIGQWHQWQGRSPASGRKDLVGLSRWPRDCADSMGIISNPLVVEKFAEG